MIRFTADGLRIVTVNNPLMPHPGHDWCAYVDGTEGTGIRGWGPSEPEAIADLLGEMDMEDDR